MYKFYGEDYTQQIATIKISPVDKTCTQISHFHWLGSPSLSKCAHLTDTSIIANVWFTFISFHGTGSTLKASRAIAGEVVRPIVNANSVVEARRCVPTHI